MPKNVNLTNQQRMFCYEYVLDHNGKRAYMAAYPNSSDKAAESASSRLLKLDKIKNFIAVLENKKLKKLDFGLEDILNELAAIGLLKETDYTDVINGTVCVYNTVDMTERQKSAIAGIKNTQYGIEIKTHDKVKALSKLLDHFELAQGESTEIEDTNDLDGEIYGDD